ncbi:MAG TPA: GNAT family N-acetyltransferase [Fimbriimonadaceae bacterium]|nr:GNAT family N-acetyltransferase [Fimbriimonadaceae bacterium]
MSLTIRPATSGDERGIARVHVDAWRDAYAGILPVETLDAQRHRGFSYEKREEMWAKILAGEHGTFVAVENGKVLGFASGGANRAEDVPCDGELTAIYVHPTAHRRGLGTALLKAVARDLVSRGFASMAVWFFQDNENARAFYRAHGAEFFCSSSYEVGGVDYPDECSIWRSLESLAAAPS